jgi:thiamine biosynthesis lipoprotein
MITSPPTAAADWSLWSTTAQLVVTDPDQLPAARALVETLLDDVDRACSRFREDSELRQVEVAGGAGVRVSPLLAELVGAALRAARRTEGDVDPTIGAWLCELGYDRDLAAVAAGPLPQVSLRLAPDWRRVRLDGDRLTLPAGTRLDLGAIAKAYAADRCAAAVADTLGCGVLVSLGGDVATAGPAPFWRVRVADGPGEPATTIRLPAGGAVATSSTRHRRWTRGDQVLHHIIDPRTGRPSVPVWRTVSAAAGDCVTANTATTAALVRGPAAIAYLTSTGLPARLVAADGRVHTAGGWPAEAPARAGGPAAMPTVADGPAALPTVAEPAAVLAGAPT